MRGSIKFFEGVNSDKVFYCFFYQLIRREKIKIPLKAFRWRVDDGPTLNAGLVCQGIRTTIAIIRDFSVGSGLPAHFPLDPRM